MHLETAMILLLCCGAVALAVAVRDDDVAVIKDYTAQQGNVARAEDDAVLQDERDSVTAGRQEDLTNRALLKAIQDTFARWETPGGSDNGGPLMLVLGQISQRVTAMGAELEVLKAQTASKFHILAQATADVQVVKEQTTSKLKDMQDQTTFELQAMKNETAAELQAIESQHTSELRAVENQTTADLLVFKAQAAAELKAGNKQTAAELKAMREQTADLKAGNKQTAAELKAMREQIAELKSANAQTTADLLLVKTQTAADVHTLQILTGQQDTAMQAVREKDRQREKAIQDARTSTYVRWGNSACGNASSLVYSGVMGGGPYDSAGSAVNHLCMTRSPVMADPYLTGEHHSRLYGTEYETVDSQHNMDAVCAVCRAAFSTTVMIPGTDTCSEGWSLQYSGRIMAGHWNHTSGTQFICVDGALQSTPNSTINHDGALLHFTRAHCGSLPCGPYVQDKLVTCAVCSK